jgi:broad specificity phosphatase PhoE
MVEVCRVVMVRHGQSWGNVFRRLVAQPPGPSLTPLGERQARAAASLILAQPRALHPQALVSSPLLRTRQTAQPLCAQLGIELCVAEGLRETGFGEWEGRTAWELASDAHFARWAADPEKFPPPGGERLSQVLARTLVTFEALAREYAGGTVAVFTHQHVMQAFLAYAWRMPLVQGTRLDVPNACVVWAEGTGRRWRVTEVSRRAAYALDHAAGG